MILNGAGGIRKKQRATRERGGYVYRILDVILKVKTKHGKKAKANGLGVLRLGRKG